MVKQTKYQDVNITMLKILALGNSLTEGFGLRREHSFASVIERYLKEKGIECEVINAGVSGDTTYGGLRRVDLYLKDAPHITLVELGINDGFLEYPTKEIQENLEKIVEKILDSGSKVVLIGTKIPEGFFGISKEYTTEFEKIFEKVAQKYKVLLIHDILGGIIGNKDLTLEDMVHPNEKGVELMADKVIEKLVSFICELKEKQQI